MRASLLVFVCLTLSSFQARGHEAANQEHVLTTEGLMRGVVRIENAVADIFEPQKQESHGTGFVMAPGLIFTNRHVVESRPIEAQRLLLIFNVPNARPEAIPAKLVFVSYLHDFAVLSFNPKALKRAKVQPLRLPSPDSLFYDFTRNELQLVGRQVLAIGNPYDSSNIVSYGAITGKRVDPMTGPSIQTQTPINPGNSGGPLLSLETGEVIGINTSKIAGGDNVGFVTPIKPLLEEYELFRRQLAEKVSPNAAHPRTQPFTLASFDEDTLKLTGLYKKVAKVQPGYWNGNSSALMVTDVAPGCTLRPDDILLAVDGELIGGMPYNLARHLQRAGHVVKMTVLRGDQKVDVDVEIRGAGWAGHRTDLDFVMVSGMFFREMLASATTNIYPGVASRVYLNSVVDSAASSFIGEAYPPDGSVLHAVNFGGGDYVIRTLFDLKRAINANRGKAFMRMRVYQAFRVSANGEPISLSNPRSGLPLIDGSLSTFDVPLSEVLTPMQFSINKFRKRFSFSNAGVATWDWRKAIEPSRLPSRCAKQLRGKPR